MKKRFLSLLTIASLIIGSFVLPGFAAPQVRVFLDGNQLEYDVQPQIINGRTMVPLAITIEYLTSTTPGWIDPTKTVFFEYQDNSYRHNVGENILYINNQPTTFDTPSTIIDSRTLVPIRMLSDGLGLATDWDPETYVVTISSNTVEAVPEPTPAPTPAPTPEPTPTLAPVQQTIDAKINSVTPNESRPTSQTLGREVTVVVTANLNTTRIKLVDDGDSSNEVIVRSFETVGDEHIFTVKWTPSLGDPGARVPKIYAGNDTEFGSDYQTARVNIITSDKGDVESAHLNSETLYVGSAVDVTVVTNPAVTRVWLNTPNDGDILENTTNYVNKDGSKVWTLKWTPKNEGLAICRAFGADANNNEDFSPLVTNVLSSQNKSVEYGKIYSVSVDKTSVKAGEFLNFSCVTTPDITNLGFVLSNGTTSSILRMVKDDVAVGQVIWKASYMTEDPGTFTCTATAKSATGDDITESIQVVVSKDGSNSDNQGAAIKSMLSDQTNINLGSEVRISIQTGPNTYAVMLAWNGQQEVPMSLVSGTDQAKIWSLDCQVSYASSQEVTFNARTIPVTNSGSQSDTRTLTIEAY